MVCLDFITILLRFLTHSVLFFSDTVLSGLAPAAVAYMEIM